MQERWQLTEPVGSLVLRADARRGSPADFLLQQHCSSCTSAPQCRSSHCPQRDVTKVNGSEPVLTLTDFALARSASNFANSFRSWTVISSFQISKATRPSKRMMPIRGRTMYSGFTPGWHSSHKMKQPVLIHYHLQPLGTNISFKLGKSYRSWRQQQDQKNINCSKIKCNSLHCRRQCELTKDSWTYSTSTVVPTA